MSLTLTLDIDGDEFERAMLRAIMEELSRLLDRLGPAIHVPVLDIVEDIIRRSPEYQSLLADDLRTLFGIADPQPVLNNIIAAVRGSIRVVRRSGSGDVVGGLAIEMLQGGMDEIIGVEGGSYESLSKRRGTVTPVPWLSWLLLEGDRVIIAEWEAHTTKGFYKGTRTEKAVMVNPTKRPSLGFTVPAQFSGVVDANWITRCLTDALPAIEKLMGESVANA